MERTKPIAETVLGALRPLHPAYLTVRPHIVTLPAV